MSALNSQIIAHIMCVLLNDWQWSYLTLIHLLLTHRHLFALFPVPGIETMIHVFHTFTKEFKNTTNAQLRVQPCQAPLTPQPNETKHICSEL